MLDSLDASFRVLAFGPPAGANQLASIIELFAIIPPDYLETVQEATEIELQHENGQYVRIWGPNGCIEMDRGYGIRQRIPGAFPIGDDGGGQVIFYDDGKRGSGLYHVGYGNLDREDDAIFLAPSLKDFLSKAIGIETF